MFFLRLKMTELFQGMSLRAMLGTAPCDLEPSIALDASRLALLGGSLTAAAHGSQTTSGF